MRRTPAPGSGGRTAAGPFRGVLVGATVATMAVAAHGMAGGGWPGSAALTLLLCIAAGIGAIATLLPVPAAISSRTALLSALAAGQLGAHLALSMTAGPGTMTMGRESGGAAGGLLDAAGLHSGPMAAAHTLATLVCATLIVIAERLYTVVSQAIRTIICPPRPLRSRPCATRWADTPDDIHRFLHAGALGSRAPPIPARTDITPFHAESTPSCPSEFRAPSSPRVPRPDWPCWPPEPPPPTSTSPHRARPRAATPS